MTLSEFAKAAGVTIERCDPAGWGGSYAYRTADAPNCLMCGYRSERAAYRGWLTDTFGERVALALIKVFRENKSSKRVAVALLKGLKE